MAAGGEADDASRPGTAPAWRARVLYPLAAILGVLAVGFAVSWLVYQDQEQRLTDEAKATLRQAGGSFTEAMEGLFGPAIGMAGALRDAEAHTRDFDAAEALFFGIGTPPVRRLTQINGAFLGFPDGSFLHVQDLLPAPLAPVVGPDYDRSLGIRRVVHAGNGTDTWHYYASGTGRWTEAAPRPSPYDPRARPWFKAATEAQGPIWTAPYTYASTGQLGVTYAEPIYDSDGRLWAVLGVDLSLEALSEVLIRTMRRAALSNDVVFATDFAKRVLGHPDIAAAGKAPGANLQALLDRYADPARFEGAVIEQVDTAGTVLQVAVEARQYMVLMNELRAERAMPLRIYIARDMDVVLAGARHTLTRNVALLFAGIVMFGIVAVYAIKMRVEVTARQRAEAQLVVARDVAEAATAAKSSFLATMSHEIRTPMNGVMSMAEILDQTRLTADQRSMTRTIRQSADALLTVINDILDFSKMEAGKLPIERVPFDLLETVYGAADLLAPRAEEKSLALYVDADLALPRLVAGDPTRIRQILLNFGSNAIKFTQEGEVTVRVRHVPGDGGLRVRIEVADSGIGLTEEQQGRLFQAFVQADSSTSRRYGGTGLGLSICKRLVEMMDGAIGVESAPGKGSTFWFELPLDVEDPAPPAPAHDVAGSVLLLVGYGDGDAAAIQATAVHAGAAAVARAFDGYGPSPALDAGLAAAGRRPDLILVNGRAGLDGIAPQLRAIRDVAALSGTAVALTAPHGAVSSLAAVPGSLPGFRHAGVATLPVHPERLWLLMAVALGKASANETSLAAGDAPAWRAPALAEAKAAGCAVLVAEDNETNQVVIRRVLARMGLAFEIAANGREALALYQPGEHGLLLSDFHMPEMDGFALTAAIRKAEASGGRARLPVVALTADALPDTEQKCLDAGMDGYLRKPIEIPRLEAVLRALLPAAFGLRGAAAEPPLDGTMEAAGPAPSDDVSGVLAGLDPQIFDTARLADSFGGFGIEAAELVADFMAKLPDRLSAVEAAMASGDHAEARHVAHAVKGAANSIGAARLGEIMSDIQDALDADDPDTASLFVQLIPQTRDELIAGLAPLAARTAAARPT